MQRKKFLALMLAAALAGQPAASISVTATETETRESEDLGSAELELESQDENQDSAENTDNAEVNEDESEEQFADSEEEIFSEGDAKSVSAKSVSFETAYKGTGKHLAAMAEKNAPAYGALGGEWMVIGLVRSGQSVNSSAYSQYKSGLVETVKAKKGVLHEKKYTEYSRVVLALTALGEDVTNVGGYNLLEPLADFDQTIWQGVNGTIWALLAFDSHDYEIPKAAAGKTQTTREKLINDILTQEVSGGGWSLMGGADSDVTGMALQALAPYYNSDPSVKAAVDRALKKLSSMQLADGTFGTMGRSTSESCSQVVTGLSALGIDCDKDSRFIKNGKSLLQGLLSYYDGREGFLHISGSGYDQMATEQAYYAMTAYSRMKDGKTSLYDMSDVEIKSDKKEEEVEKPEKKTTPTPTPTSAGKPSGKPGSTVNMVTPKPTSTPAPTPTTATEPEPSRTKTAGGTTKSASIGSGKSSKTSSKKGNTKSTDTKDKNTSSTKSKNSGTDKTKSGNSESEVKAAHTKASENIISEMKVFFDKKRKNPYPAKADDYSDKQIRELGKTWKKYESLSEGEKKAVQEDRVYKSFRKLLTSFSEAYHVDETTGANLNDNEEDVLPWYVKVVVTPKIADESEMETVRKVLGKKSEIFSLNEIHFVDTLTGDSWEPEDILNVKLPMTDLGDYESYMVVHITDEGKVEFLRGETSEGCITFDAAEFSSYGIAGFMGNSDEILSGQEKKSRPVWPWIAAGGVALFLMGILIGVRIAGVKKKDE